MVFNYEMRASEKFHKKWMKNVSNNQFSNYQYIKFKCNAKNEMEEGDLYHRTAYNFFRVFKFSTFMLKI